MMNRLKRAYISGQMVEMFIVTKWKDGCIWKTKSIGHVAYKTGEEPFNWNKTIVPTSVSTTMNKYFMGLKDE